MSFIQYNNTARACGRRQVGFEREGERKREREGGRERERRKERERQRERGRERELHLYFFRRGSLIISLTSNPSVMNYRAYTTERERDDDDAEETHA